MRLNPGQTAPDFEVTDIVTRNPVRLADFSGQRLLISFHRYAACPFCNLHIHELSKAYKDWEKLNLKILAIFCSLPDRLAEQYGSRAIPFQIAADPDLAAYHAYGIEKSTLGMLTSFVHPRGLVATLNGFLPGKIDGDVRWLPADFLISPDQTVTTAYYSSNVAQHLSLRSIEEFAR